MAAPGTSIVDELGPQESYTLLTELPSSALVDVRTRAEWAFVGVPDIAELGRPFWPVEWVSFPDMRPTTDFVDRLTAQAGGTLPERLFFICRSGARSMAAAHAVANAMQAKGQAMHCTNVAEGFEGDLDAKGHRGSRNGWKVRGLPWRQS